MIHSQSFLCLECGAGAVKLAEFELNDAGSLLLKQYGVKALGIEGSQDSKREAAVLKAIQELMAQKPYKARQANVCAPGFHVFSKFVKLPPVDTSKVTQIIQYEAQQNVPFPLEEVVWDYQIMGSTPSGELEVLLVAIKADVVEGLFRTCDASGLKLQLVDVSPAALCNAFRFNYGDLEGCTMLLDIGAKTSNLLFFEKGKVYSRGINIGANSITQDFVAEAKMPFAKAEEVKIAEGFVSLGGAYEEPENPHQAAISKIARQVMTRLHIQVNQTIQFYRGQQGGSAPQRLFLAGGASIMAYTSQFFAEKLNVPVEYFNPFRAVQIDPGVDVEELAKVAHSYGEVVGLGLRNMASCPVELNLVPKSIRKKQQFDQKKPYFLAAIFSLILVVFAFGWLYGQVATVKHGALDDLNRELAPLKKKAEIMDREQKAISDKKREIDTLTGWLNDEFYWADRLEEVRLILMNGEEQLRSHGKEAGIWIETFGAVNNETEVEEEPPPNPWAALMNSGRDPEMLRRILGMGVQLPAPPPRPVAVSTNGLSIQAKIRAVNMNTAADPSANAKLAYAIEDGFKKGVSFDKEGTNLSSELGPVEEQSQTFTFGLNLRLRDGTKL